MDDLHIDSWEDPGAEGIQRLTLTGSATIRQAAGFQQALLAALTSADEVRLDLTGITEIDLTGLQLLDASHRSAVMSGKLFRVDDGGNPCFQEAVENAGFRRHVGCARDVDGSCLWVRGGR